MILPRPLRLRADYTSTARRRIVALVLIGTSALACLAAPGRILWGIERELDAWHRGHDVPTASVRVTERATGPFRTYRALARVDDGPSERLVDLGGLTVLGSIDGARTSVRRDDTTGAVMLEGFVDAAPRRRATAVTIGLTLLVLAGVLLALAARRARELATTRSLLAGHEEIVVPRIDTRAGRLHTLELTLPPRRLPTYRENAASPVSRATYVYRDDEPAPLWLGPGDSHALIVRPSSGKGFVVVRSDFWPLALDAEEEALARSRVAQTTLQLATGSSDS